MSVELFRGGRGYRAVRIPAIAAVDAHRLVVVAVGRRRISDFGPSDLLIRTTDDGGASWTPRRVLVRGWMRTVDNPTLLVDPATGYVHLLYQSSYRHLWHRVSHDAGRTFLPRTDLTAVVRSASTPTFRIGRVAPGPGNGAVLAGGRFVVPIWVTPAGTRRPSATLTIVSDDGGVTWRAGALVAGPGGSFPNPSEATVAALPDSGVLMGFRQSRVPHRVFTRSPDGEANWTEPTAAEELFEPVCHAALASVSKGASGRLAFANPDSRDSRTPRLRDGKSARERLTLRWSDDDGQSWVDPMILDPGPSGHSSLAADETGRLHVVWEHGRLRGTPLWPTSIEYRAVKSHLSESN